MAVYHLFLALTGLLSWRVVSIATSLWVKPDPTEAAVRRSRSLGVVGGGLTAFAFAFVSPAFSPVVLLTIPLWSRLLQRLGTRAKD